MAAPGADEEEGMAFVSRDELSAAPDSGLQHSGEMSGSITLSNAICNSSHPVAAFFHIFFKLAALLVYLFCGLFTDRFVLVFVVLVLLLAFDFWTVKNVTGRLMVGLRWWNNMKEDGSNEWVFESHHGTRAIPALDWRIFWGALLLAPACWVLLGIVAALRNWQWLVIVGVALMLSGANVVGYIKCSNEAKKKLTTAVTQGALSALTGTGGNLLSGLASAAGGAAAPAPSQATYV